MTSEQLLIRAVRRYVGSAIPRIVQLRLDALARGDNRAATRYESALHDAASVLANITSSKPNKGE